MYVMIYIYIYDIQLWKIDEELFRTWLGVMKGTSAANAVLWLPLFPDVAKPNLEAMASEVRMICISMYYVSIYICRCVCAVV